MATTLDIKIQYKQIIDDALQRSEISAARAKDFYALIDALGASGVLAQGLSADAVTEGAWLRFLDAVTLDLTTIYSLLEQLYTIAEVHRATVTREIAKLKRDYQDLYEQRLLIGDSTHISAANAPSMQTTNLAKTPNAWGRQLVQLDQTVLTESAPNLEISLEGITLPFAASQNLLFTNDGEPAVSLSVTNAVGKADLLLDNLTLDNLLHSDTPPWTSTLYCDQRPVPPGQSARVLAVERSGSDNILTLDAPVFSLNDEVQVRYNYNTYEGTVIAVDGSDPAKITVDISYVLGEGAVVVSKVRDDLQWLLTHTEGSYKGGYALALMVEFSRITQVTHITIDPLGPCKLLGVCGSPELTSIEAAETYNIGEVPRELNTAVTVPVQVAYKGSAPAVRRLWLILGTDDAMIASPKGTELDYEQDIARLLEAVEEAIQHYNPSYHVPAETPSEHVLETALNTLETFTSSASTYWSVFEALRGQRRAPSSYRYEIGIQELALERRVYSVTGTSETYPINPFADVKAIRISTDIESASGDTVEFYTRLSNDLPPIQLQDGETLHLLSNEEVAGGVPDIVGSDLYQVLTPYRVVEEFELADLERTVMLSNIPFINYALISQIESARDTNHNKCFRYNPNLLDWDGQEAYQCSTTTDKFSGYRPIAVTIELDDGSIYPPDTSGYDFRQVGAPAIVTSAAPIKLVQATLSVDEYKNSQETHQLFGDHFTHTSSLEPDRIPFSLRHGYIIRGTFKLYSDSACTTLISSDHYTVDYVKGIVFVDSDIVDSATSGLWGTFAYTPYGVPNQYHMLEDPDTHAALSDLPVPPVPFVQNATDYVNHTKVQLGNFNLNQYDLKQYFPIIQYTQHGPRLTFNVDLGTFAAVNGKVRVEYMTLGVNPTIIVHMQRSAELSPIVRRLQVALEVRS